MKKISLFLLLLLVIGFGFTFFISKRLTITRAVVIHTSMKAAGRMFLNDSTLRTWWPAKDAASFSDPSSSLTYKQFFFSFKPITENYFNLTVFSGKDTLTGMMRLQKLAADSLVMEWNCSQPTHWFPPARLYSYRKATQLSEIIDELLKEIKQYAENKKQVYGYDIAVENLTDSIIIVTQQPTDKKNLYRQLATDFKKLNSYIEKYKLQITGNYMSSIKEVKNDSVLVMTGIPANTYAEQAQGINYMQMPPGGHMLTVMYSGMYKDRAKAYKALQQFVDDHEISIASLPYEKLINNYIPVSDSSVVQLKIYFPVF